MANEPIHFSLVTQVIERSDGSYTFVNADVQMFRGDTLLSTVKLLEFVKVDLPKAMTFEAVEQFAAAAVRSLARAIEEEFYTRVEADTVTRVKRVIIGE